MNTTTKTTTGRSASTTHGRARLPGRQASARRAAAVATVARKHRVRSTTDGAAVGHAHHHSVITRLRQALQNGSDLREFRHQRAD